MLYFHLNGIIMSFFFFGSNLLLLLARVVLEIQILLCLIRNISLMVIQCEVIIKVMKSIPRRNVMFSSCSMLMIAVVGMPCGSRHHRVPELDKICFISHYWHHVLSGNYPCAMIQKSVAQFMRVWLLRDRNKAQSMMLQLSFSNLFCDFDRTEGCNCYRKAWLEQFD